MLGHKLCSVMVKQEQSPELPVDPLATSSAMAAAAMATTPLLGLSPMTRLPVAHQVSLGPIHRGRGWRGGGGWISVGRAIQNPGHPGALSTEQRGPWESPDSVSAPTLGHPFTNLEQTQTTGALTVWGGRQRDPGRAGHRGPRPGSQGRRQPRTFHFLSVRILKNEETPKWKYKNYTLFPLFIFMK